MSSVIFAIPDSCSLISQPSLDGIRNGNALGSVDPPGRMLAMPSSEQAQPPQSGRPAF
jgi:hypothetical protein